MEKKNTSMDVWSFFPRKNRLLEAMLEKNIIKNPVPMGKKQKTFVPMEKNLLEKLPMDVSTAEALGHPAAAPPRAVAEPTAVAHPNS